MSYQNEFALKEIVWAKVPNYPWWPARIVNRISASKSNIYKVHFFGDPTQQLSIQRSCFLQSQYLCHFDNELIQAQSQKKNFQFLKRPIQLAKAAYYKTKIDPLDIAKNFPSLPSVSSKSQIFQESKLATNELENIQIQTWQSSKIQFQPITSECEKNYAQSTPQPMGESMLNQLKQSKGYGNKKQAIRINQQLKQQLLSKYTLLHIPEVQEKAKARNLPFSKDTRNRNQKPKDKNFIKLAFRKLSKILLKQFECTSSRARQVAEKVMVYLESSYGNNIKELSKQYVHCVHVRKSSRSIDQYLHNVCEKEEVGCLAIQEETKKEDEQRYEVIPIRYDGH